MSTRGCGRGEGRPGREKPAFKEAAHKGPSVQVGMNRMYALRQLLVPCMPQPLGCLSLLFSFWPGSGSKVDQPAACLWDHLRWGSSLGLGSANFFGHGLCLVTPVSSGTHPMPATGKLLNVCSTESSGTHALSLRQSPRSQTGNLAPPDFVNYFPRL